MLPDAEALDPSADPWPAVFALLDFVQQATPTTPADWVELVRLLDAVALARHACPTESWCYDDEQHGPLPERSHSEWWQLVAPRFPDFGYYWATLDPFDPARDENAALGDAIDDLADIAHDLQHVALARDRLGDREGRLGLGFLFDIHVGSHLRSLQRYLHLRTAGAAWDLDVGGRGTARAADPRPAIDAFLGFVLAAEPLTRAQWAQFARVLDELVMARHAVAGIATAGRAATSAPPVDPARSEVLRRRLATCDRYLQTAPLHPMDEPEGTVEPVLELRDAIADLEQMTTTLVAVTASSPSGDAHAVAAAFAAAFDPLRHGRMRDLQRYVYAVMHG
ncbi:MAG: hypothetical protein JNL12_06445 [Planctomycetes bacterium]|nr:hypothetical protein [Planctomycetota bacterium]